jgi:hypothetical protein
MSNQLALMQTNEIAAIKEKAEILIKSGFLPDAIKTPEQALAIIFYGRELGIPDWTALKHISVVKGTPQADGQLTLALIQRSGLLEKFVILRSDDRECKLLMKRAGQPELEVSCTLDEASQLKTSENGKTISLTEKYNWRQQPKTMLFYFTAKQGGRRLFSDVLNGMAGALQGELQLPDEISDVALEQIAEVRAGNTNDEKLPDWWGYLHNWAFARFEMDESALRSALEYAPDWREDKRTAMAAAIAAHCSYNVKCADEYTSTNGFQVETYEAVVRICTAYLAKQPDSEVVEAEVIP